jgi:hypothetical protein
MPQRKHNFKVGDLITVVPGVYYGMNEPLHERGIGVVVGEGPDDEEYASPETCVCVLLARERIDIHHSNLTKVC